MNLAVLFLVLFVAFMIYNENDQYAKKVAFNLRELKFVKGLLFAIRLAYPKTSFGVRLSRNECVTKEPQKTSAGRLILDIFLSERCIVNITPMSSSTHSIMGV